MQDNGSSQQSEYCESNIVGGFDVQAVNVHLSNLILGGHTHSQHSAKFNAIILEVHSLFALYQCSKGLTTRRTLLLIGHF